MKCRVSTEGLAELGFDESKVWLFDEAVVEEAREHTVTLAMGQFMVVLAVFGVAGRLSFSQKVAASRFVQTDAQND